MREHGARGQAAAECERPRGAVLSACGRYRYLLWRRFGPGPRLLVIGFNPSTADAVRDDPTVARCAALARRERAGVLEVANLYALRATDPADVRTADDPLGPDVDAQLLDAIARADRIVAAWGSLAARPADGPRVELVRRAARAARRPLLCLGTTRSGAPRHPLYLRADRLLERWRG
jgi:hypothetical protein